MNDIDPKIPLRRAIQIAGNQAKLARVLEVSKTTVTDWKNTGDEFLPPLHAYRFQRIFPDLDIAKQ